MKQEYGQGWIWVEIRVPVQLPGGNLLPSGGIPEKEDPLTNPAPEGPPRPRHRTRWWLVAALGFGSLLLVLHLLPGWVESYQNRLVRPPPYGANREAEALHRSSHVVDLHADTLLWHRDLLVTGGRGHVDLPRLIRGGVGVQVFTTVTKVPAGQNLVRNDAGGRDNISLLALVQRWPPRTWGSLLQRALYQGQRLEEAAARSRGVLRLIRGRGHLEEVLELREAGRPVVGALLGVEGGHCLEGRPENLDRLFEAGFRLVGLAHFFDNELGGSAHGVSKGGLTELGGELVAEMERRGMVIDLAHASAPLLEEVTARATRPVVVSHTGVRGTCDNPRNLSDAQLERIAATGGVIGVGFWSTAVCGSDAAAIARAIRHVAERVGVDHVALGSDFDGAVRTPFDATGLPRLTQALLEAGFQDYEIRKILGGNTLRVLRAVLPSGA